MHAYINGNYFFTFLKKKISMQEISEYTICTNNIKASNDVTSVFKLSNISVYYFQNLYKLTQCATSCIHQ